MSKAVEPTEGEDLNLKALVIDGWELHPYHYEESLRSGGVHAEAKIELPKDEVARLRNILRSEDFVPVVRRGIEDEPREMLISAEGWSEHENTFKYRLGLADRAAIDSFRQDKNVVFMNILQNNLRDRLVITHSALTELLLLLGSKKVISREEIEALQASVREGYWDRAHELAKVGDIDDID